MSVSHLAPREVNPTDKNLPSYPTLLHPQEQACPLHWAILPLRERELLAYPGADTPLKQEIDSEMHWQPSQTFCDFKVLRFTTLSHLMYLYINSNF